MLCHAIYMFNYITAVQACSNDDNFYIFVEKLDDFPKNLSNRKSAD